jgi:hypothetical protein
LLVLSVLRFAFVPKEGLHLRPNFRLLGFAPISLSGGKVDQLLLAKVVVEQSEDALQRRLDFAEGQFTSLPRRQRLLETRYLIANQVVGFIHEQGGVVGLKGREVNLVLFAGMKFHLAI